MATEPGDFRRFFDATPAALMVVDRNLRFVAANDEYVRVTATPREQLVGRLLFEVFPNDPNDPENAPAQVLRRSLERVLETGVRDHIAAISYRVPNEQGVVEERLWSATHTPLLDARGEVAFILQHTADVTALQAGSSTSRTPQETARTTRAQLEAGVVARALAVQQQKELADAERERLRSLFDSAPGFMCFLDGPDHRFVLANPAYQRLVGRSALVGRTVREALPEVVEQGFIGLLDRVYGTGTPFVGAGVRVALDRGNGRSEDAFVDFVYQPVRGPDGKVLGIFVQGQDVTERRRAEDAREAALRTAEALASELTNQSREVKNALVDAQQRITQLEKELAAAGGGASSR